MGQYYHIAFQHPGEDIIVNHRKVEGAGYVMAKLMEHSYLNNTFVDAVAHEMYKNPMYLAWIGDYAEYDEVLTATNGTLSMADVWDEESHHIFPAKDSFVYKTKWLCNHTTKEYVMFDVVQALSVQKNWVIAPFPLLTAIGNGRGGGDYHGTYMDDVGTWAWHLISIEDDIPAGYTQKMAVFNED